MKKNKENLKKQAQNCYHQECDKEKTKQNDEETWKGYKNTSKSI